MVQTCVIVHVIERSHRAAFGIGRAIHAPAHPGVHHKPRAHKARLERHIHRTARETPTPQHAGRLGHRGKLSMRGRVFIELTTVVRTCDHAPLVHHDRANGNFAFDRRRASFLEGHAHEPFIGAARANARRARAIVAPSDIEFFRAQFIHMRPLAGIRDCQFTPSVLRCYHYQSRRDGRAVECGGLENR